MHIKYFSKIPRLQQVWTVNILGDPFAIYLVRPSSSHTHWKNNSKQIANLHLHYTNLIIQYE